MRSIVAIDSIQAALFASLGIAAYACGGSTSSSATSGSTTGSSAVHTCTNPMPETLPGPDAGLYDTGFDLCQGVTYHRRAVVECFSSLPRTSLPECPATGPGCTADSECADAGGSLPYCDETAEFSTCSCITGGCLRDSDCGANQLCWCGSPVGTCVGATCASDADCGAGYECVSTYGHEAFHCTGPNDTCFSQDDCPQPSVGNSGSCSTVNACIFNGSSYSCAIQTSCGFGRPFLVGAAPRKALPVPRDEWAERLKPDVSSAPGAVRDALADHWTRTGLMEHASVAAFARFTLQLLALGAPPALVTGATNAMRDETEHARLAFGLASAYAGSSVGPGALPIDGALDRFDVPSFLATLVREGCVGETVAATEARAARDAVRDPVVYRVLEKIAREELDHSVLAWRTLAWLVESGRVSAVAALVEVNDALREARAAAGAPSRDDLAAFGVPGGAELRAVREEAHRVVARCAASLLMPRGEARNPEENALPTLAV